MKLANTISAIWKDVVNFLIMGKSELKLKHSMAILQQVYFLVRFSYHASHMGDSETKTRATVFALHENLVDIFTKYWVERIAVPNIPESVKSLFDGIGTLYSEWQNEIINNPKTEQFKGIGSAPWIDFVIYNFFDQIQSINESIEDECLLEDDHFLLSARDLLELHSIVDKHIQKII